MKTAIYIDEGVTQLVLTPDNEWEKELIGKIAKAGDRHQVLFYEGSFYACNGGWTRHVRMYQPGLHDLDKEPKSLIIKIDAPTQEARAT